jgi:hypothetical protein
LAYSVLDRQIELITRERVASLRREAERHRLVREASFHSPQQGGGAVWLGRVRTLLSTTRQRDRVHRGAVGFDERAELVCVSAAEGRGERGSGPGIR